MEFLVIAFHQRPCQVTAETVNSLVEPEGNDVLQFLTHRLRARRIVGLFPRTRRIRRQIAVVQCRLHIIVVLHVAGSAGIIAIHPFLLFRVTRLAVLAVHPYIIVAVMAVPVAVCRFHEPRMLVGSVAGNQVQADAQALRMGILDQIFQISIGPETRVDLIVVRDVISAVLEHAAEHRTNPYRIETQCLHIVQFRTDAFQVAITVAVAVLERRRINVIDGSIVKPLRITLSRRNGIKSKAFPVIAGAAFHAPSDELLHKFFIADRDAVALHRQSLRMTIIHEFLGQVCRFRPDYQVLDPEAASVHILFRITSARLHELQRCISKLRGGQDGIPVERSKHIFPVESEIVKHLDCLADAFLIHPFQLDIRRQSTLAASLQICRKRRDFQCLGIFLVPAVASVNPEFLQFIESVLRHHAGAVSGAVQFLVMHADNDPVLSHLHVGFHAAVDRNFRSLAEGQ